MLPCLSLMMEALSVTGTLVLAVFVLTIIHILWNNRRPAYLPPGPTHIPFIGNILSLTGEPLPKLFVKWRNIYGPIFSFSFGNTHNVVLGDFATVKEAFVTLGIQFAGRPDVHGPVSEKLRCYSTLYPITGIGDSTYSTEWKRQRNVTLQILRSLGYGKHTLEDKMVEEARVLCDLLRSQKRALTDPENLLAISVSNVFCSLLYGGRYDHSDAEFQALVNICGPLIIHFLNERAADSIPLLRLRPSYRQNMDAFKKTCQQLNDFNRIKVEERQARLERCGFEEEAMDFIECYLKELNDRRNGTLTENWLSPILIDLLIAGTETTASTLQWAVLWMALSPGVQRKVHEEIDRVTGGESYEFRLSDRERLPYVEATLMEILRLRPILPLNFTHTTIQEVNLSGYKLPAGTNVLSNLYGVMSDAEIWAEPEKLKPERFLGDDGNVVRPEYWIPFSMGRRACLGEQLARQELFIFFSTLMHSFFISLPDASPTPSLEGRDAMFWKPVPYKVIFTPRKK